MKIGIVGLGCVGNANKFGFEYINHEVFTHDIKHNTSIDSVLHTEIVFICVPTPMGDDNRCDTSIVESVIVDLIEKEFMGIIAIRSTVTPGFTCKMQIIYQNPKICFCAEFLRERCATEDFIDNHELLAIGTTHDDAIKIIKETHGNLPKNIVTLNPTEAEILKYYNNIFAALRIGFANLFYDLCIKLDADYSKVKQSYVLTNKLGDNYLDVREDLRGFAGMCLPKDTMAICKLAEDLNLNYKLLNALIDDNKHLKKSIIGKMRF